MITVQPASGSGKASGAFSFARKHRARCICALFAAVLVMSIVATALAATTIGTGSATEYFEFYTNSGAWDGLGTPQHWDNTNGNVAYCLQHQLDSPPGDMTYNELDPDTLMSGSVQAGLQAILEHGYPSSNGGFTADQARYATANAIRAWLSENGIGYNFMNLANDKIRPKSGYTALFDWTVGLVEIARAGNAGSIGTITVTPLSQPWRQSGGGYTATVGVTLSGMNGYSFTPPSDVTVSGYTGGSGDVLALTSATGAVVTLSFSGDSSGGGVSLYWYQPTGSGYQSVVVVDASQGGAVTAYAQITAGQQITPPPVMTPTPTPTPTPTYILTVRKTDSRTGNVVDGAEFELRQGGSTVYLRQTGPGAYEAGGSAGTFTTSRGTAVISGLEAGMYTVVEMSTPAGYVAAGVSIDVSVDGDARVDVENHPTELKMIKTDRCSGTGMSGVAFALKTASGQTVRVTQAGSGEYSYAASGGSASMITGADGGITVYGVPDGAYTVEETGRVTGYTRMSPKPITLSGQATVAVVNEPLGMELLKKDEKTQKPMPGVGFQLLDASGRPISVTGSAGTYEVSPSGDATVTTGADGKARIRYIEAGPYTVREIAPDGYAQAEDTAVTVTASNGYLSDPVEITVVNAPLSMVLTKPDALTGEPISGASFRLVDASGKTVRVQGTAGMYEVSASGTETFTTDGAGTARIDYLNAGDYTLREEGSPDGYAKAPDAALSVSESDTYRTPVSVTVEDEPLTLRVAKKDSLTQAPLAGAVFRVADASGEPVRLRPESDGTYIADTNGQETLTTGENGVAVILYLPVGTYRVIEVNAPVGYALAKETAAAVEDTHGTGSPQSVEVADEPTALEIVKTDKLTGRPLPGAEFHLIGPDGQPLEFTKTEDGRYRYGPAGMLRQRIFRSVMTDADGKAVLVYVPVGDYTLREVTAPSGYARTADATVKLTVRHGLSAPLVFALADDVPTLEIVKTDKLTKKAMAGVVFTLSLDGETVRAVQQEGGEWYAGPDGTEGLITDAQGRTVLRYLPLGTYRLTETAPKGYARPAPMEIVITEKHGIAAPYRAAVTNRPTVLEILKTDMTTGKAMGGMEFRVLDSGGNPVKLKQQTDGAWHPAEDGDGTFKVDGDGKALLRYLPVGAYTLEETATPIGYANLPPQDVTVSADSDTANPTKVHIRNQPLRLAVEKVDALTGLPVRSLSIGRYTASSVAVTRTAETAGTVGGGISVPPSAGAVQTQAPVAATRYAAEGPLPKAGSRSDVFTFRLIGPDGKPIRLTERDGYLIPDTHGKEVHGVSADKSSAGSVVADILYLPAGIYTVEEVSAPTGYAKGSAVTVAVKAENGTEDPAKVTIADNPLALEISKIRKDNGKGLSGAGFTVAVRGSDRPLTFTVRDGRYEYDPAGKETTVNVDRQGKAFIAYLPIGVYDIVETVVPSGFFAAPAQTVTVEDRHTVDAPAAVAVENQAAVKLGLDSDRLRVPIAIGLLLLASLGGAAVFAVTRNKRRRLRT